MGMCYDTDRSETIAEAESRLGLTPPAFITSFDEYRSWVVCRWAEHLVEDFDRNVSIAGLGLGGESGEVQEHVKKYLRNGRPLGGNEALMLELGDVFHYWLVLCFASRLDPLDVMRANVQKLNKREIEGKGPR